MSDSCLFYFVTKHSASGVDRTKRGQLDWVCAKALPSPCRVIAREEQGEQTVPPSAAPKTGNYCGTRRIYPASRGGGAEADRRGGLGAEDNSIIRVRLLSFWLRVARSDADSNTRTQRERDRRRSTRSRRDTGGRTWLLVAGARCQSVGCGSLLAATRLVSFSKGIKLAAEWCVCK